MLKIFGFHSLDIFPPRKWLAFISFCMKSCYMAKFQSLIGMSIGVNLVWCPIFSKSNHYFSESGQAFIGSAADQTGDFLSPPGITQEKGRRHGNENNLQ